MLAIKHLPALQILIPFFGALIATITPGHFSSWLVASACALCSLALSIYGLKEVEHGISYAFGGFLPPIGIEYRLDYLNQPIIIFVNFVLSFFLILGHNLIDMTIMRYISERKQNYFYAILLFAHSGYLGVLSTNDLFNLYVFIEISSLATYVMMSKGNNRYSIIGAFDYLTMGTIGATMILISIGFFLAKSGSLNITDISEILKDHYDSNIVITAIVFFLTGAVLKMAFFPMHFWMIRAYSVAPPFILTYLASISSLMGVYIIVRFIFFTVEGADLQQSITNIFHPLAIATIIICTILALRSGHFKRVVIYSSASQIGYIFLLMTIWTAKDLMFMLIILDGLNKIALFTIIALIEDKVDSLRFSKFKHIEASAAFKIAASLSLLFSASLPITSMFFVKVQLFEILLQKGLMLEFTVVIFGSVAALLYHFRIGKALFFSSTENGTITINKNYLSLVVVVGVQVLTLLYINDLSFMTRFTETIILGNEVNEMLIE